MLIESKIKIGYDSMFNVPQAYFKSAHLLNKMALVQFQCSRTVAAEVQKCGIYRQIKRKAFRTFGLHRNCWDHDPLIRAVIKNRGKSFSRRTSLALWSRNLWSIALYIYVAMDWG